MSDPNETRSDPFKREWMAEGFRSFQGGILQRSNGVWGIFTELGAQDSLLVEDASLDYGSWPE